MAERPTRATNRTVLRATLAGAVGLVAFILSGCAAGGLGSVTSNAEPRVGDTAQPSVVAGSPSLRDLMAALTRSGVGPDQVALELTYAPPLFFEVTGLEPPGEASARPTLAFMLQETVHDGALSEEPPEVLLVLDSGARANPYDIKVTAEDPHHRTTRLLFADSGEALPASQAPGSQQALRLEVPFADGTTSAGNTFKWKLPINLDSAAQITSPGASQ